MEELHRAGFVGSTGVRSVWNAAWLGGTDETRFMSVWRPLLVPWRGPLFHMVRLDDPDNLMVLLGFLARGFGPTHDYALVEQGGSIIIMAG